MLIASFNHCSIHATAHNDGAVLVSFVNKPHHLYYFHKDADDTFDFGAGSVQPMERCPAFIRKNLEGAPFPYLPA